MHTAGRNGNWCNHCGKYMEVPLKIKNRTAIWSSYCTPGYISRKKKKQGKTRILKDTCTLMFRTALLIVTKIQNLNVHVQMN